VPHFHIHIIPRKTNDGLEIWPKLPGAIYEIEEVYKKIIKEINC
jgi:histidine triad (HIT) family protein